jgi:hypothetical protein
LRKESLTPGAVKVEFKDSIGDEDNTGAHTYLNSSAYQRGSLDLLRFGI